MNESLMKERLGLFNDAIALKKPKRIPTMGNVYGWKAFDSDSKVKLSEIATDWDLAEKVLREHIERYNFDGNMDLGTRLNNSLAEIFGTAHTIINDETGAVNVVDQPMMENISELSEQARDSVMFHYCKAMPRRYGRLTYGQVQDAVKALMSYGQWYKKSAQISVEDYSAPLLCKGYAMHSVERVFDNYFGIKNFSIALRRNTSELKDYFDKMQPSLEGAADAALSGEKGYAVYNVYTAFLAHSVMSAKQFGALYWPYYKKVVDKVVEANASLIIYIEAATMPIADFLREIPAGHAVVHPETDDMFELRKALPNICLQGGMPLTALGWGDVNECLDTAKKLCDGLSGDGFIFSESKMMAFKNDGKRENLLAVQDYVLNYKI